MTKPNRPHPVGLSARSPAGPLWALTPDDDKWLSHQILWDVIVFSKGDDNRRWDKASTLCLAGLSCDLTWLQAGPGGASPEGLPWPLAHCSQPIRRCQPGDHLGAGAGVVDHLGLSSLCACGFEVLPHAVRP